MREKQLSMHGVGAQNLCKISENSAPFSIQGEGAHMLNVLRAVLGVYRHHTHPKIPRFKKEIIKNQSMRHGRSREGKKSILEYILT